MPRIGYARVSTSEQGLAIQVERLEAAGCSVVRSETASGATREGRGELKIILDFIRDGDELVVLRIDRLARSIRDVLNIVHELAAKGASLRVLEPEVVSTGGALGKITIAVLGMAADLELNFIQDRQRAGIDAARAKGIYKGRRKSLPVDEIRRLASLGLKKARIARQLGISRVSVYRVLKDAPAVGPGPEPEVTTPPAAPLPSPAPTAPAPGTAIVPVPSEPDATAPQEIEPKGPPSFHLVLSLTVEINRKGTRGRKRAIADIEAELAWQGLLEDDPPADGDYAITLEVYPNYYSGDALDQAVEELIGDLGRIADRRYCYVEALVREPATGRTWAGVEPAKADRRRRPPKRKARPARHRRPSHPFETLERALADRADSFHRASGFGIGPHVIRKGEGADTVYYLDAHDRQSAWHPDLAKARQFPTYDLALDVLDLLLDGDLTQPHAEDFDIVQL